mgnify:CR=1 FL=1|tara:strand:+ start:177 stop:524 length:348 start_codon:yes stop_codon:yes gene_type:complete
MSHQDWKPVIFNKKKTQTKRGPGRSHASKIEQSEDTKVKLFPKDLVKQIIQHRVNLKLNRKQFAHKLNMKEGQLAKIEGGKAPHNSALVGKFKRMINNHKKMLEKKKKKKEEGDK